MPIELLLTDLDQRAPVLPGPVPDGSMPAAAPALSHAPFVFHGGSQRDSLAVQKWAVIVPRGAEMLADWIQPLSERRWAQSGQAAPRDRWVFPVAPGMSRADAETWRRDVLERIPLARRPRYLLILGDLDQVSLALQQELMTSAFVGRLCFKTDDGAPDRAGYQAYCDKVCALEDAQDDREGHAWRDDARLLFYADRAPGDDDLEVAYVDLVRQSYKDAQADADLPHAGLRCFGRHRDHPWHTPDNDATAAARSLLHWAAGAHPSILLSVTHGVGALDARQRRSQGALVIHDPHTGAREVWDHARFRDRAFLPGGFWFLKACFGAGTPTASVYARWLQQLADQGVVKVDPSIALQYLAAEGDGFSARLPQAALANPRGPLGIVAHVDLTWTFGFQDPTGNPEHPMPGGGHTPYYDVLRMVAMGSRLGNAVSSLSERANVVATDLAQRYGEYEENGRDPDHHRALRAWLWMQHLDLSGYVLLGDPAAQVATASARAVREHEQSLRRRRHQRRTAAASPHDELGHGPEAMAEAVLRRLGGEDGALIAAELGIAEDTLQEWAGTYRDAGLAAMRRLCSARQPQGNDPAGT